MNLHGTAEIRADRLDVWSFLVAPERVAECIAGVQDVSQLDESTFQGIIQMAVGPIKGSFFLTARMTEASRKDRIAADVDGYDSVTGSRVAVVAHAELQESDDGGTRLSYWATVEPHGRLAILGDMILRATASLLFQRFVACLQARLATEVVGHSDL